MTPDRRTFLAQAGLAALAVSSASTLSSCSSPAPTPGTTSGSLPPGSGASVPVADIPLDGGIILSDTQFVVTQPAPGTYKAFGSTCPHQGCTVAAIENREIICPCHDSRFSIEDGSVLTGPATESLPQATATVDGENIAIS
ncbi:MAG: Rieske (2Fe-2S) protein [Propioniciclava sp.]